ncbi:hypothetical protein ACFQFH_17780 [Halobaculum halobium]|uniref:DUF7312 domain-containing protein n=1 Tax=Halobaculum halobium TaxID=3032281 RepID=UPI0036206F48
MPPPNRTATRTAPSGASASTTSGPRPRPRARPRETPIEPESIDAENALFVVAGVLGTLLLVFSVTL